MSQQLSRTHPTPVNNRMLTTLLHSHLTAAAFASDCSYRTKSIRVGADAVLVPRHTTSLHGQLSHVHRMLTKDSLVIPGTTVLLVMIVTLQ